MYKRLCEFIAYIDEQTSRDNLSKLSEKEREEIRRQLLDQIQFFQHERLIHLIVTHMFALITIVTLVGMMYFQTISLFLLMVLEIGLLFPYVVHYYHLENGTQTLYTYYDRFCGRTFGDKNEKDRKNNTK
ncbi:MAG: hypothetical protein IIZ59_01660 [Clostridia bacterium]|nr:hypothetical protein [Clostridia bacterium]